MGFQHLKVYQVALLLRKEFDRLLSQLTPRQKQTFKNMLKHVDESIDSILNNIAEGNDTKYPNKKLNFIDTARGSAKEARNGIQSVADRGGFTQKAIFKAVGFTYVIDKMLGGMMD